MLTLPTRVLGPQDGKAGFLGSIGVRFMIDGETTVAAALHGARALYRGDIARDLAGKRRFRIHAFGVDVERQHAVGEWPPSRVAPLPLSAPPSSSQISARPEPLCSPKARIAPSPVL